MQLNDKVAIITGGGTGIGKATALSFAKQGAKIVVTGRRIEPLQQTVEDIKNIGGEAIYVRQDVSDISSWEQVFAETISTFGTLDILVNNAGIALAGDVETTSIEQWRNTQSINLEGVFVGTQGAIKLMKENGGSIINVSSIEGIIGEPLVAAYNAAKGGVRLFTKSAALHCAKAGYNIRINSIHPGVITTAMTTSSIVEQIGEELAEQASQYLLAKVPMGRPGTPEEIAAGMVFLASDASSYMTGSELVIDGGYTAQ